MQHASYRVLQVKHQSDGMGPEIPGHSSKVMLISMHYTLDQALRLERGTSQ